jgi:hypothetical protein
VLNLPCRLFLHRSRVAVLAQSKLAAVGLAFKAIERAGGVKADCIDSTIARLLCALDLCTPYCEGLLIGNK